MSLNSQYLPLQYGLPMGNQQVFTDPVSYLNNYIGPMNNQYGNYSQPLNDYYSTPQVMNVHPMGIPSGITSLGTAALATPNSGLYQGAPPLTQPIGSFINPSISGLYQPPASIVNMPQMYPAPVNMHQIIPGMPLPMSDMPYPLPYPDNFIQPFDVYEDSGEKDKTIDYFYKKCQHEWIYSYFRDAYKYLKVVSGKVKYITSLNEYKNKTKDSNSEIDLKADFVKIKYLTHDFVKRQLLVYAQRTDLKWFELKRNEQYIIDILVSKLKNAIKQDIARLVKQNQ